MAAPPTANLIDTFLAAALLESYSVKTETLRLRPLDAELVTLMASRLQHDTALARSGVPGSLHGSCRHG